MKIKIENGEFDTLLQPTDWRYSAAIAGLVLYFEYNSFNYQILEEAEKVPENAVKGFDGILYNQSDIDEEHFLLFAENYFAEDMTHLKIINTLNKDEYSEEDIKYVNDLIKSKTILKNIFSKLKFDGSNDDYIIQTIEENKLKIIKEIFRNGKNLYSNFCNSNLLLTDKNPHCRLTGYNVDEGRKTKYLGFCFSKESFVGNDIIEFDFIPFAFTKTYESYFINNNCSIKMLLKTKTNLDEEISKQTSSNSRDKLLTILKNADSFVNYDVEIITLQRGDSCYRTLFVRYERLKALKKIPPENLSFSYSIGDNYWLNLEQEVYERCLNNVLLDDLIELMLKIYFNKNINSKAVRYRTNLLININEYWKGNELMYELKAANEKGKKVSEKLIKEKKVNKLISYKQKLTGALTAHDYDRVNEIILNLEVYVGMEFKFFYKLLENPEKNKNIAFAFVSALTDEIDYKNKKDTEE